MFGNDTPISIDILVHNQLVLTRQLFGNWVKHARCATLTSCIDNVLVDLEHQSEAAEISPNLSLIDSSRTVLQR